MRKHEKKTEPEPANAGPEAEMMSIPRTEYAEPATEPAAQPKNDQAPAGAEAAPPAANPGGGS